MEGEPDPDPPPPSLHEILIAAWEGLETARDAETSRRHMVILLRHYQSVPGEWLSRVADLIEAWPFEGGGAGRSPKDARHEEIEQKYFRREIKMRRVDAAREIAAKYAIEQDTAEDLYDKVRAAYAPQPYADVSISVRDDDPEDEKLPRSGRGKNRRKN